MPRDRRLFLALAILALAYALLAGLRTVGDPDIGWTLATGRYLATHRHIPSTDVFSYTARGREWIYPPFSGVVLYTVFLLGGFAALSWFSAAACLLTIALLLMSAEAAGVAVLAMIAVPSVALRTAPRANVFTTVLFAAFLCLLWRHFRGGRAPLWLLPPLMIAWVNLHLGFISGLALVGAYVFMECVELPLRDRRANALTRLRKAAPWLGLTVLATFVNPWGPRLYAAISRQERILQPIGEFVGEWAKVRLTSASLHEAFAWRSPDSSYWWLLAAAGVAVVLSGARLRLGPALVLLAGAVLSTRYVRFQGLFALLAVCLAGTILSEWAQPPASPARRVGVQVRLAMFGALALLVGIRATDLITNRYYLSAGEISLFGAGPSWWYPERAASFLLRERLPPHLFNNYNLGGYLAWRAGPEYAVYIDGRAVPFGAEQFFHYLSLMQQVPDSPEWQREADARNINTLLLSSTRYPALGSIPLKQFCQSGIWRPVYLDEVSAVFVRHRPENARWLDRLQIDCAAARFSPPPGASRAELYEFYANSGAALFALSRNDEALAAWNQAERIFAGDAYLHLLKGSLLQATGRVREAAQEYSVALRIRPSEETWLAVGQAQAQRGAYAEALQSLAQAAAYSASPYRAYAVRAQVYLAMKQPENALRAFDQTEEHSPYRGASLELGAPFRAEVAAGRARAWRERGDLRRAAQYQEQAVRLTPGDAARWLDLAGLYEAQGLNDRAAQARDRARSLQTQ